MAVSREPAGPAARRLPAFWLGVALVVGTALLWFPSWPGAGWSFDDRQAVLENPLVTGHRSGWDAWSEDYWHHRGAAGLYRPLVTLSFRAQRSGAAAGQESAIDPESLHLVNRLLHLWVVLLAAGLWCRPRLRSPGSPPGSGVGIAPWIALGVFAWHPVQSEAVLWIAGRSVTLAALLGLLAWTLWERVRGGSRPVVAFVGSAAPILAKEEGIAFAAVFWVLARDTPQAWRTRGAVLAGLGAVVALRTQALGSLAAGLSAGAFHPATVWERAIDGLQAWGLALRALFGPTAVPLSVPPGTELAGQAYWVALGAGLLLFLVVSVGRAWRTSSHAPSGLAPTVRAGFVGGLVALLPWLQVIPAPETFGLRMLYLPLLFAVSAVAACSWRWHRAGWLAIGAFGLWCAWGIHQLAPAYRSALGYWEYRAEREPQRALVWNGLGNEQFAARQFESARESFRTAVEVNPEYSRSWVGLALLAERRGDFPEAQRSLRRALEAQPGNGVAHANLARLLRSEQPERALHHWQRAVHAQPGRMALWRGLAAAQWQLGRIDEARTSLLRALALQPDDPVLLERAQRYGLEPAPSAPGDR